MPCSLLCVGKRGSGGASSAASGAPRHLPPRIAREEEEHRRQMHQRQQAAAAAQVAPLNDSTTATAAASNVDTAFPALDRMLAAKNLRERRMQIEQPAVLHVDTRAFQQPQHPMSVPMQPTTYSQHYAQAAYQTVFAQPQQPIYAQPFQQQSHPLPVPPPSLAPQPSVAPAYSAPAPHPIPLDPEPLSPSSLDDILLLPEVQEYLEDLKEKWRTEWEESQIVHQQKEKTKHGKMVKQRQESDTVVAAAVVETKENSAAKDALLTETRQQLAETEAAHAATKEQLEALQKSFTELQETHSHCHLHTTTLQTQVDALAISLKESEKIATERQTAADAVKAELVALQSKNIDLEHSRLLKLESELSSLTLDRASFRAQVEEWSARAEREAQATKAAERRLQSANEQIERQSTELKGYQHKVDEQTDATEHARSELAHSQEDVHRLSTELRSLQHLLEDTKHHCSLTLKDISSQLHESERQKTLVIAEHAARADKLQMEVERARGEIDDLKAKLKEQEKHADERLTGEEASKRQQLQFIEQLHANLDALSADAQAKASENAALQSELKQLLGAFELHRSKSSSKLTALREALSQKQGEVEDCKVLLKTMLGEEKQTRAEKMATERTNERLRADLKEATEKLARAKDEIQRLTTVAVSSTTAASSSSPSTEHRLLTLEKDLKIAAEIHQRLESEKEHLAVRLEEAEERARQMGQEMETARSNHQQHQEEHHDDGLPSTAEQLAELQRALHDTQDKLSIKEKILDSLTDQLSSETKSALQAQSDARAAKKLVAELEKQIGEMDEQRREAQREVQAARRDVAEWERLESENDELREQLDLASQEATKQSALLAKKTSSLTYIEEEVADMKKMFRRKEDDLRRTEEKRREQLEKEVRDLQEEVNRLYAEMKKAQADHQEASNLVHQTEQEMRVLVVELDRERKQRKQMKQQLQNLFPDM
jgi:chromosome segregation ATPase